MTDQAERPTPRLWTEHGFADDPWRHAESVDEAGNDRLILPLAAWLGLDAATRASGLHAVVLAPGEALDRIVPHLGELPMVALAFPAYNDGRSYSKAELLRKRYGYDRPVRAVGDVLIDQIPHMLRTGFSEFEVSNPTALQRLEAGRIGGLPLHYQPAARHSAAGPTYSWRRKPAA